MGVPVWRTPQFRIGLTKPLVKTAPPWVIPGQQDGTRGESFPVEFSVVYDPPDGKVPRKDLYLSVSALILAASYWLPIARQTDMGGIGIHYSTQYGPLTDSDIGKPIKFNGTVWVNNFWSAAGTYGRQSFFVPACLFFVARLGWPYIDIMAPTCVFPNCLVVTPDTAADKATGSQLLAQLAAELLSPQALESMAPELSRWRDCYKPSLSFVGTPSLGIIPAGEPFEVKHGFRNKGNDIIVPYDTTPLKITSGGGPCRIELDGIKQEFKASPQTDYTLTEAGTMPFDDLVKVYDIKALSFWAPYLRIQDIKIDGNKGTLLPFWIPTDAQKLPFTIKAGFPDVRISGTPPSVVPAGEQYGFNSVFQNIGFGGSIKGLLGSQEILSATTLDANRQVTVPLSLTMPYDDVVTSIIAQVLGRGKQWTTTDKNDIQIKAGFPQAVLGGVEASARLKPGDDFSIDFPITNSGYRGDVGVRLVAPDFKQDIMQRIDGEATITPRFSGQMPVAESYKITAASIHLGRNQATIRGAEKVIEIKPMNCLLQWEKVVDIIGGYSEPNTVQGFVAGKNVKISGLNAIPGTGGPGPLGSIIPYGGYILSGNLGPNDSARIEFDELYFLKVEVSKGIATARLGSLLERDTKSYEYSVLPSLAMAAQTVKSLGTRLTKSACRLG